MKDKTYLIGELNLFGIYETLNGEPLYKLDYETLRSMLAVQMAVRS